MQLQLLLVWVQLVLVSLLSWLPLLAADWIAGLGGDNAGGNLATLLTNIGKGIGGFLGGFAGETMEQMKIH